MNLLCSVSGVTSAIFLCGIAAGCGPGAAVDSVRAGASNTENPQDAEHARKRNAPPGGLSPEAEMLLPTVEGRLGQLALDRDRARLYVAAEDNGTLEVVDLETKRRGRSIGGFQKPRGVLFLGELERVIVSNGGTGALIVLDARSYKRLETLDVGAGIGEIAFDPKTKLVYAALEGNAIAIVDTTGWKLAGKIDLSARASGFALEPNGVRLFANVQPNGAIDVFDRSARKALGHWSLDAFQADGPLLSVDDGARLFATSREPAKLVVIETLTGTKVGGTELAGACGDLIYDAPTDRLFVPCASGVLQVFTRVGAGRFTLSNSLGTGVGATTGLFDPPTHKLYVALPAVLEKDGKTTRPARVLSFEDLP